MLKRTSAKILKWAYRLAAAAVIILVTIVFVWAFQARRLPDLDVWHEPLDHEVDAGDLDDGMSFDDYLEAEEQVFSEVDEEVYREAEPGASTIPDRYVSGSLSDPRRMFDRNWNRTAILQPDGAITSGAVLLHGLTDSPYSMRSIAEILSSRGCYTVCLRMPGHGTAPGSLVEAEWEDWFAALKVAAEHVRETVGAEAKLYLGGYSTGGSIALKYAMRALDDDTLEKPHKIFLLGPPVRVHPLARLTKIHRLLSWTEFFEKFKWLGVQLEFDPFKYNSFPKNGGVQSFRLSRSLLRDMAKIRKDKRMGDLPPIITFQSVVDATVLTGAVVNDLYMPMEPNGSELILFDVNRYSAMQQFMRDRGRKILDDLDKKDSLPFTLKVVSNVSNSSREATLSTREQGARTMGEPQPLGLLWPHQVYSLSHVALPFRPDDPVYGFLVQPDDADHHFRLGAATPRGERRLLQIPMDMFMRLRSNPFFNLVEKRINAHLDADGAPAAAVADDAAL